MKIAVTGATGMVGEGVLYECLNHPAVDEVYSISRKPSGMTHVKLKEVLISDFTNPGDSFNALNGINACLFCAGVSSVGKSEEEFTGLTYDVVIGFAREFYKHNPASVFCYISGAGTDSSEKGRVMWARVKGRTENDLQKIGFKAVYNFRPGVLQPTPGLKRTLKYYRYLGWLMPLIRKIAPDSISTLRELGLAMIHVSLKGYPKSIIEVSDIHKLAKPD